MTPARVEFAEIAAVAGDAAAVALIVARGGMTVWVRADAAPDWLVEIVGKPAADRIVAHVRILSADGRHSGTRITIPLGGTSHARRARRVLAEALQAGLSATEAARRAGVHERTAYRMQRLIQARRNMSQLDLF